MSYSMADLRRIYWRATNGESVSDAEYRELAAAYAAGLDFSSIVDMADSVATESFNDMFTEAGRGWAYALQNRGTTPAKWLCFGDSYEELGALAQNMHRTSQHFNGWYDNGFLGGGQKWTTSVDAFGNLTTTGTVNSGDGTGPQGYDIEITGSETIGSFTFGGTGVDLHFEPDLGEVSIVIDGGAPVVFDTSTNNGVYTVTGLEWLKTHSCTITNSTATNRFWGYYPYTMGGASGMRYYWVGKSGSTLTFANSLASNVTLAEQIGPDKITIEFGINDYGAGIDVYEEQLETFVTALRVPAPLASYELWVPPQALNKDDWEAFSRRMRSKARELGMGYVDVFAALGRIDGAFDLYGASTDDVHLDATAAAVASRAWMEAAFPNSMALGGFATEVDSIKRRSGVVTRSGKYSQPPSSARNNVAPNLNRLIYYPIRFTTNVFFYGATIEALAAEVTTSGGAGSVARLGLYDNSAVGDKPVNKLCEVTIDCSTTGLKETAKSLYTGGGLLWIAFVVQVVGSTMRSFTPTEILGTGSPAGTNPCTHYYESGVTGALPAVANAAPTDGTGNVPLVWLKS